MKSFLFFLKTFLTRLRRFALRILCPAGNLCFHSFGRCDWFVASSHDFDENKEIVSLTDFFHSYFIKAIDHSFYGFILAQLTTWDIYWENTRKACKSRAVWRVIY